MNQLQNYLQSCQEGNRKSSLNQIYSFSNFRDMIQRQIEQSQQATQNQGVPFPTKTPVITHKEVASHSHQECFKQIKQLQQESQYHLPKKQNGIAYQQSKKRLLVQSAKINNCSNDKKQNYGFLKHANNLSNSQENNISQSKNINSSQVGAGIKCYDYTSYNSFQSFIIDKTQAVQQKASIQNHKNPTYRKSSIPIANNNKKPQNYYQKSKNKQIKIKKSMSYAQQKSMISSQSNSTLQMKECRSPSLGYDVNNLPNKPKASPPKANTLQQQQPLTAKISACQIPHQSNNLQVNSNGYRKTTTSFIQKNNTQKQQYCHHNKNVQNQNQQAIMKVAENEMTPLNVLQQVQLNAIQQSNFQQFLNQYFKNNENTEISKQKNQQQIIQSTKAPKQFEKRTQSIPLNSCQTSAMQQVDQIKQQAPAQAQLQGEYVMQSKGEQVMSMLKMKLDISQTFHTLRNKLDAQKQQSCSNNHINSISVKKANANAQSTTDFPLKEQNNFHINQENNQIGKTKNNQVVHDKFELSKNSFRLCHTIGKGGFGRVWKVQLKNTNLHYALKEMSKSKIITKRSVNSVLNERNLLCNLRHEHIININFAFQDSDNLYLIMDFLSGGDLRYHIGMNHSFTERQTKFFIANILLGLEYLHENNIIHRDIKPENLVLDSRGYVRITDLGIARILKADNFNDTSGTPGYMAPEVMCRQNHGFEVDYFALGVIGYEFMLGKRPYLGRSRKEIRDNILERQVQIKANEVPHGWSMEGMNFINRMIQRKPMNRLGANGISEIKSHPWLADVQWDLLSSKQLQSPFVPSQTDDNFDQKQQVSNESTDMDQIQLNSLQLRRNSVQS